MSPSPASALRLHGTATDRADGFALAVIRRMDARTVAIAVLVSCALAMLVDICFHPHPKWTWFRLEALVSGATALLGVFVATMVADEAHARGAPRFRCYAAAVGLGATIGALVQWHVVVAVVGPLSWSKGPGGLWFIQPFNSFLESVLVGSLAVGVYVNGRTSLAAMRRMHTAEQARVAAQRRTLESQLQAMQARIEPRFLFDTLAQVHALYDLDGARAGAMLEDLIAYLRAALPHLRRSTSTVGREIELVSAFINIAGASAGRPFDFRARVDAAVTDASLPGMLLLPLAQQALPHSTWLRLDAHAAAGHLRLVLAVDGTGLAPQPSNTALNALRERLHALFGDAAVLALVAEPEGGSRATLELPLLPAQDLPVPTVLRKESS